MKSDRKVFLHLSDIHLREEEIRSGVDRDMGVALLRRPFFRLFIGIFARGRFLFCSFCAGTELRTAPTRLFRAASPS